MAHDGTGGWRLPSFSLPFAVPRSTLAHCAVDLVAEDFRREHHRPRPSVSSIDRDALRRAMRRTRRALPQQDRRIAARRFTLIADRAHLLKPRSRIGVYHAYGAEADLTHLIHRAWQRGCELYLPVITHRRSSRMEFFRFDPRTPLTKNAFGIPEPPADAAARIAVLHLDIIFMPLVAFDPFGTRLGSGAGFYDRCLQHLHAARVWRRPKLIGVAYAQQQVARLDPSPWDVPMDGVITQHAFKRFPTQRLGAAP
jgi:5-formyltetrahydrofolate cyclo-ligase